MARILQNIKLIGGNSPNWILEITDGGTPITGSNLKNYTAKILIARHDNSYADELPNGYIATFYYDHSIRKLRTVIPHNITNQLNGNYTYVASVFCPTGEEIRRHFGHFNVIKGVE
ncbi:hypothetical protein FACS1894132_05800 [Clostridia bacterium]|nr:hypothetical protein FACS1894132_05800 [Clostridia bacterium]